MRFVIEQYRDELMTSMRHSLGGDIKELETNSAEDREAVASDLLNVLHSIPIQSIATNGPSLVHKVRFVASTLLDAVRKAETAPASAARAHAYLCEFLRTLCAHLRTLTGGACRVRGLPVHPVRDREELPVSASGEMRSGPRADPAIGRLDDERDAASSADGMPLVGSN